MTTQTLNKTQKYLPSTLYVMHGSRSGNSKAAAVLANDYAKFLGMESELLDMQEFMPEDIAQIKNILITVSTHGEGDPPIQAENLLHHLLKINSKKMEGANFSVLALGDSSYRHFCKTGHDFQAELLRLGAHKIHELTECDIDFEENAKQWIEEAVAGFSKILPVNKNGKDTKFTFEFIDSDEELSNTYKAKVLAKKILNEPSSDHQLMHVELSLKNSGIQYKPGDTIGIHSSNSKRVVDKLLKQLNFDPTHVILSRDKKKMLKQALITDYELTLLTPVVIKKYAEFGKNSSLEKLLENKEQVKNYCLTKDIIDLVAEFPIKISPANFITVLRKLPARLYSASSSLNKYPEEVHLMVRLIDFDENNRRHEGVCSSFLSTRIEDGESVNIFHENNRKFSLPENKTDIIMFGAGTGLAPFRSFLQERDYVKANGKNWLFFGERKQSTDFYYQDEFENYSQKGLLNKLTTAFSRDQKEKIYLSNRMLENSNELFDWIENGAVLYLCGNKRKFAKSVRETLVEIIKKEGQLSPDEATEYIAKMKQEKRYAEDVY